MWSVQIETQNGEKRAFLALSTYELTEEQKLLWKSVMGEEQKVTNARIKCIIERKIEDEHE